jgi:hypothetical protein
MARRPALALAVLLCASPAVAEHCGPGLIWRVHLHKCFAAGSPQALAFGGRHLGRRRVHVALVERRVEGVRVDTAPSELDEAAFLLAPLLEAAARRWAGMVSPAPIIATPNPEASQWPSVGRLEEPQ